MGRGDRRRRRPPPTEAMRRDDGRDRDRRHDRHRRGRARRGADAVHRRAGRAGADRDDAPRDRHRGRPARGHEPRRARPGRRDHRPRRVRDGRPRSTRRTRTSRSCASGRWPPARSTSATPPTENLHRIAEALGRTVSDITVIILDRPRHDDLIAEVREAGARIKLISDGDLSAAISLRRLGHRRPRGHGHRRRARGRHHRRRAALPRRRDPGPLPVPQRRGARARRADGPRRRGAASTGPRTSPRARTSSSRRPA